MFLEKPYRPKWTFLVAGLLVALLALISIAYVISRDDGLLLARHQIVTTSADGLRPFPRPGLEETEQLPDMERDETQKPQDRQILKGAAILGACTTPQQCTVAR
jgi:hypothetical protein